eukprot:GHVS01022839.1.p2 GENE.GHVS01022839.1~~GHVS01022839.1.p2  ORF type:complete len:157 (+),score=28.46 GHVS01022839.1:249-719(+)
MSDRSMSPEDQADRRRGQVRNVVASERRANVKGRGGREGVGDDDRYHGSGGVWNTLDEQEPGQSGGPARSIEGWIVAVTGVHEEAQEEDLHEVFGNFGDIKNLHLNLDRRTGFVKGYAFIEYEKFSQAKEAIAKMNGEMLLDQEIHVDWGFVNERS